MAEGRKAPSAYAPAAYEEPDIHAMQALAAGVASADQQRRVLDWIVLHAASTYDQPFQPGGEDGRRATDFACGRMFVGQQIVKLTKLSVKTPAGLAPSPSKRGPHERSTSAQRRSKDRS